MGKSRLYTFIMFLLAVCVIFGGWFITVKLLRQREEKFLGSTGRIKVQTEETALFADSEQDSNEENEDTEIAQDGFHGQAMSEYTRALVLAVWDYGGNEVPHEPLYGQMDREQAVDAGRNWIKNMAEHGVFTGELQESDSDMVKAGLYTIDTPLIVSDMDRSVYSYWKVQYIKSGVMVDLTIHASSGEVWMASISVEESDGPVESYDLAELLGYAYPFMETGNTIWVDKKNGMIAESSLNEMVIASAKRYSVWISGQNPQIVIDFKLNCK